MIRIFVKKINEITKNEVITTCSFVINAIALCTNVHNILSVKRKQIKRKKNIDKENAQEIAEVGEQQKKMNKYIMKK